MKSVLITGISRGIGRGTAEKFLKEGWNVFGTSTSGISRFKHDKLEVFRLDLSNPRSILSFSKKFSSLGKNIDVLINNAGVNLEDSEKITMKNLRNTLEVNLVGLINLTENLLPCIKNGGHIISLSSGYASITEISGSNAPSYRISKAGVNMYTRILSGRLSSKKITVSSIDPGWVKTDMGGIGAEREPTEPAKEIFDLANSDIESGYFWHRGKKAAW